MYLCICLRAYMESNQAAIGLLIILLLIVGANFVMYAIARGAAKGGNSRWMSALKDSLSKPMNTPANQSMDELRKRVEELEKKQEE
jgi:multisubunit Na+/H+ antiporter MnhG subunit